MTSPAGTDAAAVASGLRRLAACAAVSLAATPIEQPGRRADSAAADAAVAVAVAALGLDVALPIARHDDGRPAWPRGVTGSMAHAGHVAVAAVARGDAPTDAVGIDVEVAGALPAIDAVAVLAPAEQAEVATHAAPDERATLVWAAKEAAYKAWSTGTGGALVDVDPVEIHIAGGASPPGAGQAGDGVEALTAHAVGRLAAMAAPVGPLRGWCTRAGRYVLVLFVAADRAATRGPHQGRDGIASEAITSPSAANATP